MWNKELILPLILPQRWELVRPSSLFLEVTWDDGQDWLWDGEEEDRLEPLRIRRVHLALAASNLGWPSAQTGAHHLSAAHTAGPGFRTVRAGGLARVERESNENTFRFCQEDINFKVTKMALNFPFSLNNLHIYFFPDYRPLISFFLRTLILENLELQILSLFLWT